MIFKLLGSILQLLKMKKEAIDTSNSLIQKYEMKLNELMV